MPLITPKVSAETLLRTFAASGDNAAFSGIVSSHAGLVYSTALRLLGEYRHLADDVSQSVFADLASKACTLPDDVGLAGWLHQHTCFLARKALRTELRRLRREDTAHAMNPSDDTTDVLWLQVRPLLDDALGELAEADRQALVLRFLQGRPFKSVAETLSTTDDAARMRVGRALDRLRDVLAKRGVLTTSDALDGALTGFATASAPAALNAAIADSSATAAVSSAVPLLTAMKAAKIAAAALVVAGGVLLVRQYQDHARLADELARLRPLQAELDKLRDEKDRLSARVPSIDEVNAARRSLDELQKLRGQVSLLRKTVENQSNELAIISAADKEPDWNEIASKIIQHYTASAESSLKPGDTLVLGGWETSPGKTTIVMLTPKVVDDGASIEIESRFIDAPTPALKEMKLEWNRSGTNQVGAVAELEGETARAILEQFTLRQGVDILSSPKVQTGNGREARVEVTEMTTVGKLTFALGPSFNVVPTIQPDGKIGLAIKTSITLKDAPKP